MRHLFSGLLLATTLACGSARNPAASASGDPGAGGDPTHGDALQACGPSQIPRPQGGCVTTCQRTEDCQDPTLVCNLDLGVCVAAPPVLECDPATCQPGSGCPPPGQGQDCVPLAPGVCNVDQDCGLLERCAGGGCVSRAGDVVLTCTGDGDCPLMMTCQLGICLGCVDDLQCGLNGPGGKCVYGTCVVADLGPAGECLNKTCSAGEKCVLATGQCTKTCAADAECATDQRCLPIGNYCVADFGCETAADCTIPLLQQCLMGLCVGCTGDGECRASEKCMVGTCFPRLDGNVCDTVTCATQGDICDPANGSCYPANGTCVDASDCRPGHSCNFLHLCSGCSVDGDCRPSQRCLLATCVPVTN
ncbi:MAG: hypothetical protein HY903_11250 [Deltaproteobacteria bacterium]|nr:hypothetical protein [Deltaproteobacteria bacterium]